VIEPALYFHYGKSCELLAESANFLGDEKNCSGFSADAGFDGHGRRSVWAFWQRSCAAGI
jgi:hypothetical protein